MSNSTPNVSGDGLASPAARGGDATAATAASHALLATYALLCVCGVVANGAVIGAVASSKKRYVSDAYVVNLAVADLLFTLGMPFLAHQLVSEQRWRFGAFMCKALTLVDVNNQYTSVGTVTVLCIDRYVAVSRPLTASSSRSIRTALAINAAVWLCSLLLSLPAPVFARVLRIHGVDVCALDFPDPRRGATAYAVTNFVLAFAAPLGLISVFYALTLGRVSGAMRRARLRRQSARSRRVTRTAVAIVVAFAACWAPFHALQMVGLTLSEPTGGFHLASQLSICLGYAHSCINPVLLIFFTEFFKGRLPCARLPAGRGRRCCSSRSSRSRHPRSCCVCCRCCCCCCCRDEGSTAAVGSGETTSRSGERRSACCGRETAKGDDDDEEDARVEEAAATVLSVMTTAAAAAAATSVGEEGGAGSESAAKRVVADPRGGSARPSRKSGSREQFSSHTEE